MTVSEAEVSKYIARAHDGSNMPRPPWSRSVYRELIEAEQPQAQAKSAEATELRQLRQRVAQLERMVLGKNAVLLRVVGKAIGQTHKAIDGQIKAIADREPVPIPLPVLDQHDRPTMRYCGLWSATKAYQPGDTATFNGGGWVAQIGSTGLKPGDGVGWKLAVKSDTASLRAIVKDEVTRQLKGARR